MCWGSMLFFCCVRDQPVQRVVLVLFFDELFLREDHLFLRLVVPEKFGEGGSQRGENIHQRADGRAGQLVFQLRNIPFRQLAPVCQLFLRQFALEPQRLDFFPDLLSRSLLFINTKLLLELVKPTFRIFSRKIKV